MYSDIEILLPPLIVSSITGTTLSLTVYSIFCNLENTLSMLKQIHYFKNFCYFVLAAATSFILSFFSTITYIIFQNKFLIMPISLGFLTGGGLLIFISIIYLGGLLFLDNVLCDLKKSNQFPELFH